MEVSSLRSKLLRKKLHSKKGFTLVEAMCSVVILAIVCVGVLNAVAFSREMIYSNNARDKASDKAQLVADEIASAVTGISPAAGNRYELIDSKVNAIANDETGADVQARVIGKVKRVGAFATPANDSDPTNPLIQYTIKEVGVDSDTDSTVKMKSGSTDTDIDVKVHKAVRAGWDIQVRVYYKQIGGSNDYKVVDFKAFAPVDVAGTT